MRHYIAHMLLWLVRGIYPEWVEQQRRLFAQVIADEYANGYMAGWDECYAAVFGRVEPEANSANVNAYNHPASTKSDRSN